MNERKYQVFISSTYADLKEERKRITEILLMADCIPAGMEAFVATDVEQFEVIKKVIDLCDYYILIIGRKYGSVNPNTGVSYTEMEYDYAIEKGIPALVFAIDQSVDLPDDKIEKDKEKEKEQKYLLFRKKALNNRLCSIWKNLDDLIGKVAISIMTAKGTFERPGWQRGSDFDEASLRRTIMELKEENDDLKVKLSEANETIKTFTITENIEFEDYEVKINYHYNWEGSYEKTGCVEVKLPEVFVVMATEMMDVSLTEQAIADAIKDKLIPVKRYLVYIDDSQQIKVILNQLRVLGLIYSSWNKEKNRLYWGLTAKGKVCRDNMIVVKKTVSKDSEQ